LPKSVISGMAQTVLGPVRPEDLGPTSTHEHLLIDYVCMHKHPSEASEQRFARLPVTMEILGRIRYDPFSNLDNLMLDDENTAVAEALLFKRAGGKTIVDATTIGIGRDPRALARISRMAGINVIMGAGYYVDMVHPRDMTAKSVDDLAKQLVVEVQEGVGDTGIKAGIIGEIGCSWPLTANERKVVIAAAQAQQATGAPVLIHPGRNEYAPHEIVRILKESGADVPRVIISHMDRTISSAKALLELADMGCTVEYDLFGVEVSNYTLANFDMLNDAQRIGFIKLLVDKGHGTRVVTAHDIYSKHRLVKYGGHGYGYVLENMVPRMRKKGISDEAIEQIIVKTPARLLAFA